MTSRFEFSVMMMMIWSVFLVLMISTATLQQSQAFGTTHHNLDLIDLEIIDIQTLFVNDTPGYYLDDADLLKVTVNVTNNNLDYFLVQDKMFRIWVMEPDILKSTPENEVLEMVDNYETSYDSELEVNYDDLPSDEMFEECDFTNDRVMVGHSKVFTLCYEILRIWQNEALILDGKKKYFLTMMDNDRATSCPNCKKIDLSDFKTNLETDDEIHPRWIQKIFDWHEQGIISQKEFQTFIDYLVSKKIISGKFSNDDSFGIPSSNNTLEEKNRQLKDHQTQLSKLNNNNLYVSHQKFYESKHLSDNFTGLVCKQQNNVVTLSGDYTNNNDDNAISYDSIFFKLLVFDSENVVATGISKIVDVASKEFRHFSVSAVHRNDLTHCLVLVDSKFPSASIDS
ncbi:hypothetical protein [Nitrosopumilus sp.]|uniref:hypothetical protein n=1 Tax=Nitrosopumilus sp. TaxID=2024843 RepID=UPI00292CF170|nr:hypothetical protein [Nitrosopumilus sp.]